LTIDLENIKTIFERLRNEPFPSERGKEIKGIDLVLIDADTIGIASKFIAHKGHLSIEELKILENCFVELKTIVPHLEKNERQYFASLRQLAKEMLEFAKDKVLPNAELEKRNNWKIVYNQIKNIVNEIDPLGVADMVDDEYDDLNFRIYSQLLEDRQDDKMLITIKKFIAEYYETQVNERQIADAVLKLKNIKI
jgi:hypothetical protein